MNQEHEKTPEVRIQEPDEIQELWGFIEPYPYLKKAIESLTYEGKAYHIRLRDGYRLRDGKKYVKQASFPGSLSACAVWSSFLSLHVAKEEDFLLAQKAVDEISPEAKEKIELIIYEWPERPLEPGYPWQKKYAKYAISILLKNDWPNSFQSKTPSRFLYFTFEDLKTGKHLEALKDKYFMRRIHS